MNTLLWEPTSRSNQSIDAAERLRASTAAVRVSFTWFGTRKSLSSDQKAQAAESFGAQGKFLTAGKKLLDSSHPAFKAVTAIRGQAIHLWKGMSLPFPEPGIRLIRQQDVSVFDQQMAEHQTQLAEAVNHLDDQFEELRSAARKRLGSLYAAEDYPASLRGLFGIIWDYPSVEPPDYLRRLDPQLYEQECQRVSSRFDDALRLAEEGFLAELNRLVSHLAERLSGQEDGKPKIFRDTAVENLREFFGRFRKLSVRSISELDAVVEQAESLLKGVAPQDLRNDQSRRQQVVSRLSGIQATLDGLMIDRPRRSIIRSSQKGNS